MDQQHHIDFYLRKGTLKSGGHYGVLDDQKIFQMGEVRESTYPVHDDILMAGYLRLDHIHFTVEVKKAKYFPIIAQIGGIRGWLIQIFTLITGFVSKRLFENSILGALFLVKKRGEGDVEHNKEGESDLDIEVEEEKDPEKRTNETVK